MCSLCKMNVVNYVEKSLAQNVYETKGKTACGPCYFTCWFWEIPTCLGCSSNTACLCWDCRSVCALTRLDLTVKCCQSFALLKTSSQCCCYRTGCAIPCDDEIPCMLGVCGIMCKDFGEDPSLAKIGRPSDASQIANCTNITMVAPPTVEVVQAVEVAAVPVAEEVER